ncbi:hypothetical protein [Cytobacillus sp. IB215665]|uniref:hypothetical protein n=1 Tax=Cytobacillus sp. IB215665 TaxID=3097357 RepID=UPI002A12DA87|nr:hypothetical protein [Cytobacillus sp. IB215665]MDX8367705.1 hypothetical protein [Cytobacillus sp. IB215665]
MLSKDDAASLLVKLTSSSLIMNSTLLLAIVDRFAITGNQLFWIVALVAYLTSVISNFVRQLDVKDRYFDISALRFMQNKLFNKIMSPYISTNPFNFSTLYDFLRDLSSHSTEQFKPVIEDWVKTKQEMDDIQNTSVILSQNIQELNKARTNQAKLINHLIKTMQRISKGKFDKDDLMLGIDYSLFECTNDQLLLRASHGLTSTPEKIDLDNLSKKQEDWAVIYAMQDEDEDFWDDESHGRRVVSKRFKMEDGTIYVYSFHFHESQSENYDIIYLKDVARILYSIIYHWHNCQRRTQVKGEIL